MLVKVLPVAGQHHVVGISGGVNRASTVTSKDFSIQSNPRNGVSAGLSYEYLAKQRYSAGVDLLYAQRGFTSDMVATSALGQATTHSTKFKYDYLSLPIKAGLHEGDKLYGFVNVGLAPSLLVHAKTVSPRFEIDNVVIEQEVVDVLNRIKKFDLAGLAEFGGGYKFKSTYWLFASLSYQRSFTSFTTPDYFSGNTMKHKAITLSVGVKYLLK